MDTNTKPFGVGIRGTGQVAYNYVKAVEQNPYLYLAAVCSRSEDSAVKLALHYNPEATIYTNYQEMLADAKVDIVAVCTPNSLHALEAIQAFQAKKHLILEVPVAITYKELQELRTVVRKAETKSVVSFVLRWHPMVGNLKALLNKQTIGEIFYAEADYWYGIQTTLPGYNWIRQKEFAGGAMFIGGGHAADIIRYLTEKEVDEVFAYSCKARQDFDYDTTIMASVKFMDGTIGKFSVSLEGTGFPDQLNISLLGTEGAIRNNRLYSQPLFPEHTDFITIPSTMPDPGSISQHLFQQELDAFTDHLLYGTPIRSNVLDACNSVEIALAIEESAIVEKPVKIIGM